jgi:outer membrane protein OmpA-like peptidoglycan-associated protein
MTRALLLATIAAFAAACAMPHQDRAGYDRPDIVSANGYAGATGPHGAKGPTGLASEPGYASEHRTGETGPARLKGWSYAGTTGLVVDDPAGTVAVWATWCDFGFDHGEAGLPASEMEPISVIAAYLVQNPSLDIGIDGSMSDGFSRTARDLSDRRAVSIRDALLQAGVPAYKILMGAFSNPDRRQENAIQVLVKTRA